MSVVRYWTLVLKMAATNAAHFIHWNDWRKAALPLLSAVFASLFMGAITHNVLGYSDKIMWALAIFATLFVLAMCVFLWQMVIIPPQLAQQHEQKASVDFASLQSRVTELGAEIEKLKTGGVAVRENPRDKQDRELKERREKDEAKRRERIERARQAIQSHLDAVPHPYSYGDAYGWVAGANVILRDTNQQTISYRAGENESESKQRTQFQQAVATLRSRLATVD